MIRTSIAPSESTLTLKDSPVVVIDVDRDAVGRDNRSAAAVPNLETKTLRLAASAARTFCQKYQRSRGNALDDGL